MLHEGVNLHVWGINGDMQALNKITKPIATYLGINIIICHKTFKIFFIVILQKVMIFLVKTQFLDQFVQSWHLKLRFLQ